MDIGIHMNKYNIIRKNIGNAGNYFPINPFQSNLYDTFQRKQTSKQSLIHQDIQLLQNQPTKKKKITLDSILTNLEDTKDKKEQKKEDTKDKKEDTKDKKEDTKDKKEEKKEDKKEEDKSANPDFKVVQNLINDPSMKTIHITNLSPESGKNELII